MPGGVAGERPVKVVPYADAFFVRLLERHVEHGLSRLRTEIPSVFADKN
jgi:hypothetical protein